MRTHVSLFLVKVGQPERAVAAVALGHRVVRWRHGGAFDDVPVPLFAKTTEAESPFQIGVSRLQFRIRPPSLPPYLTICTLFSGSMTMERPPPKAMDETGRSREAARPPLMGSGGRPPLPSEVLSPPEGRRKGLLLLKVHSVSRVGTRLHV